MSESWYALHVKPRFESYVSNQLSVKGYETFLPSYIAKRKWSDRVKSLSLPLFPGYVFSRFEVNSRLPILVTPGVMAVVGSGRIPTPIDDVEMAAIRRLIDSGVPAQRWPYLNCGEMVRVEDGPLEGLTGIVVRLKGMDRLVVSVSLLMRSVSVEIERNSVKPIGYTKGVVREHTELAVASPYSFK